MNNTYTYHYCARKGDLYRDGWIETTERIQFNKDSYDSLKKIILGLDCDVNEWTILSLTLL